VSLAVMPMFHMAGSGWALVGLYEGCPTVVLRDVDPPAILNAVARHRITNMLLVPAVIQVENVLMTHPEVGTSPSEADLIAYARERLGGFKLPKSVDFAEVLPGKLLKRTLREPYWEGVGRRIG
jgi:long-chain acyl-CoA synthetase